MYCEYAESLFAARDEITFALLATASAYDPVPENRLFIELISAFLNFSSSIERFPSLESEIPTLPRRFLFFEVSWTRLKVLVETAPESMADPALIVEL